MSKTKTQKAAEERAAKKTAAQPEVQPQPAVGPNPGQINTGKVNEQPKPKAEQKQPAATPAPAAAAQPRKQTQTIEKLKEGWTAKGVSLDKLSIKDDGKFKLLVVAEGWPTVQVGASGGITVLELKSYSRAFDAAMEGLGLYQKQQAREQKKATATAPTAPAAKAPAAEKQLQTASA
jgi:hypothetical protein